MRRDKYLSEQEFRRLIAITRTRAHTSPTRGNVSRWLVVDIALQTGLRVGEMAKLTVADYHGPHRTLNVWRTKKQAPTRDQIAISPSLCAHIDSILQQRGGSAPTGALFVGERGPMTKRGLQQAWTRACELAGIPGVSIHGARHTLAVHLLRRSKNLRLVQKQLGHGDPATTANMYADVPHEDRLEALTGVFG